MTQAKCDKSYVSPPSGIMKSWWVGRFLTTAKARSTLKVRIRANWALLGGHFMLMQIIKWILWSIPWLTQSMSCTCSFPKKRMAVVGYSALTSRTVGHSTYLFTQMTKKPSTRLEWKKTSIKERLKVANIYPSICLRSSTKISLIKDWWPTIKSANKYTNARSAKTSTKCSW